MRSALIRRAVKSIYDVSDIIVSDISLNLRVLNKSSINDYLSRVIDAYENANKTYECPICCESFKIEMFYFLDCCDRKVCWNCIKEHVKYHIDSNQLDIKCPLSNDCNNNGMIQYSEVKNILAEDKELWEKYDRLLLLKTDGIIHCPGKDCNGRFVIDEGIQFPVCPICHFEFCKLCLKQSHKNKTCEEFKEWLIQQDKEEKLNEEWKNSHTKRCPKCGASIEKSVGCNKMICSECKTIFCFLCCKVFPTSNACYDHFTGNPYCYLYDSQRNDKTAQ